MQDVPIACDPSALSNEEREWLMSGFMILFSHTAEVKALPEGFGFRFPSADLDQFVHIAKLVALNRLCCPFVEHAIVQQAGNLDVWLYMSGRAGTKAALKSDIIQFAEDGSDFMQMFLALDEA